MISVLFPLIHALVGLLAFAGNGKFDAPTIEEYKQLNLSEHRAYKRAIDKVKGNDYYVISENIGYGQKKVVHSGPSHYATEAGRAELQEISARLLNLTQKYGTIVFVGRSGAGIKAYLEGVISRDQTVSQASLKEFPFSCNDPQFLTKEQKLGLRRHFEANGITPEAILSAEKPVLFMDFVHSGIGVNTMMKLLYEWASEKGVDRVAMKAKLGFFGAFPARMMAINNMIRVNHDSSKEGAPIDMSEENIQKWARDRKLMNGGEMKHSWVSEVFEFRLTDEFYHYGGSHAEHPNPSFKPEVWDSNFDREQKPTFKGKQDSMPHVELYYLMSEGRKESAKIKKHASCVVPLLYK